jgi:GNAT superfamily N-acetyltransferase
MEVRVVSSKELKVDRRLIEKISDITLENENLTYRSPNSIKDSVRKGFFLFALDKSGGILGWIERHEIWDNWWNLSTLYVFPKFRNTGVGRETLIPKGIEELEGKNIFAAVGDREIQKILEGFGFKEVRVADLPFMFKFNLIVKRYLNVKSLMKFLKIKSKGLNYFVRIANDF